MWCNLTVTMHGHIVRMCYAKHFINNYNINHHLIAYGVEIISK